MRLVVVPEYAGPWPERPRLRLARPMALTLVQCAGLGAAVEHAQAGLAVWLVGWLLFLASLPEKAFR